MGKYVESWIPAVCSKGFVASNFAGTSQIMKLFSFSTCLFSVFDQIVFSLCGCGAYELHTTLVALDLVAFLVWAILLLLFECGKWDCATKCTWMLC